MTHALVIHAGPAYAHTFRAILTAAFCAGALALLCAAAVLNGPAAPSTSAAGAGDIPALAPMSVDHSAAQLDNDTAVRPQVGGIGWRHALRKPRRTNRRLRVPGRNRAHLGSVRAGISGIGGTQLQLKRKRMSKRALMRRLMTVRGGLQA